MTLAVTAAVLLTLPAIRPLYADDGWVGPCVGAVLVVQAVAFVGRVIRVPALLQPMLGLVGLLLYASILFARQTLSVIVPTADTFRVMGDLLQSGSDSVATIIAPVPTVDSLVLLGVLASGGIALLVDTVAVLARRAALTGLPLLLLFAAPAAIAQTSVGWWPFALAGTGWLLVLLADGTERVHRWGVVLAAPGRRAKPGGGLSHAGSRIAVVAVGMAVALPILLPDVGDAGELGDGPRTVTTYNPLTKLRGQLTLPDPRTILTYTTTAAAPNYLRMTTLGVYDGGGWQQGSLSGNLDDDGVEDRTLPTPVGLGQDTATGMITATVDIATLKAYWLPVPPVPSQIEVEGPWLWDASSGSVFATRTDTTKVGPYTVRSIDIAPVASNLRAASAQIPEEIEPFTKMPTVTPYVRAITERVVAGSDGPFDKALALQGYFRSPNFRYSLRTATGSSPDALEDFLRNKQGYCEQYASAMAAMLRVAGVPARVAVGFTPGRPRADGSRVVTTEQAHAWPEAWIAGAGWVRFEPTPSQGFAPAYTRQPSPAPAPEPSVEPTPTNRPSPGPVAGQPQPPAQNDRALPGAANGDDTSFPTGLALSLLAVLALLAVPSAAHAWRRRARWREPGPRAAWAQLRDDAFDVGLPLDPARSPRQALDSLAEQAVLDEPDRQALDAIALAVQTHRYAPAGRSLPEINLQQETTTVRGALHARLSRRRRLRLLALPPSTVRWAGKRALSVLRTATDQVAGSGAGLASRLRRS